MRISNEANTKVVIPAAAAALALFLALPCLADWERNEVDGGAPANVASVAVGDANNDGDNEVVAGGEGSGLRIYDGAKSSWTSEEIVGGLTVNSVTISDGDNDGEQEVICGTVAKKVLLYEYTGSIWIERVVDSNAGAEVLSVCCGDADNDGLNEIIAGTLTFSIYVYEGSGDSWTKTLVDGNTGGSNGAVFVGDADEDGQKEIVCGTGGNDVLMYKKNGGIWDEYTVDDGSAGSAINCIDIGDSDGDGHVEIVAGTSGKDVFRYRWNGASWSKDTIVAGAVGNVNGVNICDADYDGSIGLAVITGAAQASNNKVLLYEKGPSDWHSAEADSQVEGRALSLTVGDADDDGTAELIVGTSGVGTRNVFIYDELIFVGALRDVGTEDITITWGSESGVTYEVYYSSLPYSGFAYVKDVVASGDTTEWTDDGTDIGVHPKDVSERYYKVKIQGTETYSNSVGKFTRSFGSEMHLTSFPLVPYSNSVQDLFGTQLTGSPEECYADRVWKWDREIQDFVFAWLVDSVAPQYNGVWWNSEPFGPSTMTLDFGEGFFVQTRTDSQSVTFVGGVPSRVVSPMTTETGMQIVGTAWPETLMLDSCDFYASGAKGAPAELSADRVWYWDESVLFYDYAWLVDSTETADDGKWWCSDPWGPSSMNMTPGYGYWYQARGNGFRWKFWK